MLDLCLCIQASQFDVYLQCLDIRRSYRIVSEYIHSSLRKSYFIRAFNFQQGMFIDSSILQPEPDVEGVAAADARPPVWEDVGQEVARAAVQQTVAAEAGAELAAPAHPRPHRPGAGGEHLE